MFIQHNSSNGEQHYQCEEMETVFWLFGFPIVCIQAMLQGQNHILQVNACKWKTTN